MSEISYQSSWYGWIAMCFSCPKSWEKAIFSETGWNFSFNTVDILKMSHAG